MRKPDMFKVAYVNWKGEWVTAPGAATTSRAKANRLRLKIAKAKALNGQATVYICN
jgi:hypothetical protein